GPTDLRFPKLSVCSRVVRRIETSAVLIHLEARHNADLGRHVRVGPMPGIEKDPNDTSRNYQNRVVSTNQVRKRKIQGDDMAASVIQHVLKRLKAIGISEIFGVAGDYAFPEDDAIVNFPEIEWVGCCNELNAGYAADGYARIRGAGAICTTYGVGE